MKKIFILLSLLLLLLSCHKQSHSDENYVILVSFDGSRWDYPDIYSTPNFDDMAKKGTKAEWLISSFPTKTFPNHYTIATGLYPDHHGLINNTFYAPDLDLLYRIGDRKMVENPDFYGGEPIWNTAEKQGVKSATFFWVGSEAPIQGIRPSFWKLYDGNIPFDARVDTVINWLKLPLEKRPRLILLYFDQPDGIGHDYGPEHEETGRVVTELDQILGELRNKLKQLPISNRINLIVTSDHGMGAISPERYVNLDDYLEDDWVDFITGSNPVILIDAKDNFRDSIVASLDAVTGVSAWKKENIPAHLKYGSNNRIPDILVVADSSWSIGTGANAGKYTGGTHGYDNSDMDMNTIFYAEGPSFRSDYVQPPFENVNIYPLIAYLLDLEPAENDGNLDNVRSLLKE